MRLFNLLDYWLDFVLVDGKWSYELYMTIFKSVLIQLLKTNTEKRMKKKTEVSKKENEK